MSAPRNMDRHPKRPSTSSHYGCSAKRSREYYRKSVKVLVYPPGHPFRKAEPFIVPEELLFESEHIKSNLREQAEPKCLSIHNTEPVHFKCYLDWIDHGVPVDTGDVDNGTKSFLSRLADPGDDKIVIESGTALVLKLCCLLTLNEFKLKHHGFKDEVLTKLRKHTNVKSQWTFMSLDYFMKLWEVARGTRWFHDWIITWKSPSLTREDVDAKSSTMDADLVAILHKVTLPLMLEIQFGTGRFHSVHRVNRKMALGRARKLADKAQGRSTVFINDHENAGLVRMWFATFDRVEDDLLDVHKLSQSQADERRTELCRLWTLADHYDDTQLRRAIITFFITNLSDRSAKDCEVITLSLMKNVDDLKRGCGLRRWFIDFVATTSTAAMWRHSNLLTGRGLQNDFIARLVEIREDEGATPQAPQLLDLDKYCKAS